MPHLWTLWTTKEKALVERLCAEGLTREAIHQRFPGRSYGAVNHQIHEIGLLPRRHSAMSDERIELLKKLWADGLTARQVAAEMGMTRNAVIGKVHRLDLPKRIKTNPPGRTPRPRQTGRRMVGWKPKQAPILRVVTSRIPSLNIPFIETREGQCREITSDSPALCCGHPIYDQNNCAFHYSINRMSTRVIAGGAPPEIKQELAA
jgi:hypothetical protein